MNILVTRDISTARSLTSKVTTHSTGDDPSPVFSCFGLEPAWDATGKIKPRAIPPGTFDLKIQFSPKHGRRVPVLQNVPDFTMVEIHWGNFEFAHEDAQGLWHPPDSDACLVVGAQRGTDEVLVSKPTFDRLFALVDEAEVRGETNTITYVNAWENLHEAA